MDPPPRHHRHNRRAFNPPPLDLRRQTGHRMTRACAAKMRAQRGPTFPHHVASTIRREQWASHRPLASQIAGQEPEAKAHRAYRKQREYLAVYYHDSYYSQKKKQVVSFQRSSRAKFPDRPAASPSPTICHETLSTCPWSAQSIRCNSPLLRKSHAAASSSSSFDFRVQSTSKQNQRAHDAHHHHGRLASPSFPSLSIILF